MNQLAGDRHTLGHVCVCVCLSEYIKTPLNALAAPLEVNATETPSPLKIPLEDVLKWV